MFLEEDKTKKRATHDSKQVAATYWGHRFEHVCMNSTAPSSDLSLQERFDEPVNTYREFGIVVKAKLGRHRLIFGAEVDGLDVDGKNYVELKTNRQLQNDHHVTNLYKFKFDKFWAQSFLAGVPRILIGFRNYRGILQSLDYLDVASIPKLTRGRVSWCPETMLQFGIEFIDWLRDNMKGVADDKVMRLTFGDHIVSKPSIKLMVAEPQMPSFILPEFTHSLYY